MTETLYRKDFYAWTQQQAELLQAEEFEHLDLPNLIEELESMGVSQRKEIRSRLTVLLMHLLKWQYQMNRRSRKSWQNNIDTQRTEIEYVLTDSPSLRRALADTIAYVYPKARASAARETGLALSTFPADCPWTVEEILDTEWWPL